MSYESWKAETIGWKHMRGWIDAGDGRPWRDCSINELTRESARLSLRGANALPNTFVLHFTETGSLAKRCRVVERAPEIVNVTFR